MTKDHPIPWEYFNHSHLLKSQMCRKMSKQLIFFFICIVIVSMLNYAINCAHKNQLDVTIVVAVSGTTNKLFSYQYFQKVLWPLQWSILGMSILFQLYFQTEQQKRLMVIKWLYCNNVTSKDIIHVFWQLLQVRLHGRILF